MTAPWMFHRPEFLRLVGLLDPTAPGASVLSTWDAGEWEFAVEDVAEILSDRHTPLLRADRAAVLELAAAFGVAAKAASALRWCPDLEADDEWWREIEGSPRASAVEGELSREITTGHTLHGIELMPWLECGACDEVLVRLDDENARTGRGRYQVAVVHLAWSRPPEPPPWPSTVVFDRALDALDRLEICFRGALEADAPAAD
ncbi:hypothetical protein [Kitasatospora purpeofusca]|uniref:hypothetical protein n=1 Tax=Kitasatospora purpeofusca TaxID=67352 RepID=UPI00381C2043